MERLVVRPLDDLRGRDRPHARRVPAAQAVSDRDDCLDLHLHRIEANHAVCADPDAGSFRPHPDSRQEVVGCARLRRGNGSGAGLPAYLEPPDRRDVRGDAEYHVRDALGARSAGRLHRQGEPLRLKR